MYKAIILSFILFFTLHSATAQCIADFSVDINRNHVSFRAINPVNDFKYSWDLGDGNTKELAYYNTYGSHVYQNSGLYDITLSAIDSVNNVTYIVKKQVNLRFSGCTPDFKIIQDTINGRTFHFESTTVTDNDTVQYYTWSIENIGWVRDGSKLTYRFADTGYYNICLEVYTQSCYNKICKPLYVSDFANCDSRAAFTSTINRDTVSFTANDTDAGLFHTWNFGDGSYKEGYGISTLQHLYDSTGNYTILHTIRDTAKLCVDSVFQYIYVTVQDTCVADFSIIKDSIVNTNDYYFIYNRASNTSPAQSYEWYVDSVYQNINNDSLFKRFNNPGMYNICLRVTYQNGCIAIVCKNLEIITDTVCNISSGFFDSVAVDNPLKVFFRSIGNQSSVQYAWSFGDGTFTTISDASPVHTYTQPGTYYVKLFARDTLNDCSDSTGRYITVNSTTDSSASNRSYLQSYPNPVTGGFLNMTLYMDKAEQVLISIYNANGNIVYTDKRSGWAGNNNVKILVSNLPQGQYFVDIRHGLQRKRSVFLKL